MSSGWGKMHPLYLPWQSQCWQWGAHSPGLTLTLGRLVREFSFLTLLTKKPYFLNVFAGANLRAPSHVLPIPTGLPTAAWLCADSLNGGQALLASQGKAFCESQAKPGLAQLMGALRD